MTTVKQSKLSFPRWLIPLLIIGIIAVLFGNSLLKTFNSLEFSQSDEKTKIDEGYEFVNYGYALSVEGSNLIAPGSIQNVRQLSEKVNPGNSYIQDNANMTSMFISAKKEDLKSIKVHVGEFTIGFAVKEEASKITIVPVLSGIPKNAKSISFGSALHSNMKPAPDSYIKDTNSYVENLINGGKESAITYETATWNKAQTIYVRVTMFKKSPIN